MFTLVDGSKIFQFDVYRYTVYIRVKEGNIFKLVISYITHVQASKTPQD